MTMTNLCFIGSRIKQARKEKHLTQAQLAEMIDRSTADYILCDAVSYGYRVRLEEYAEWIYKLSKKEKVNLAKLLKK